MFDEILLDGYNELKSYDKIDVDFTIYFSKKEKIKSIEKQLISIENSNKDLEYSINNITFEIDDSLPSMSAGERVSTSHSTESYIEKKFTTEINKLEKLIESNNKKIFELVHIKNKIMLEISDMNIFIDMMSDFYSDILYKKYVDKKTLLEIGIDLNCSEGTVRKYIKNIKKSYREYTKSLI